MSLGPASAQEVARQSLRELAAQAAGVGTYVLHLPSQELIADDRVLELSGLDRTSFTGRLEDIHSRIHPDDVGQVIAEVERAMSVGEPYSCEYRVIGPGRGIRWTAARGQTLTDEAGTITARLGALYDVTGAHADSARSIQILETMSAAFYALDLQWRFTYVNGPAEALIGYSRQEAVGHVVWDLFPATRGSVIETTYRAAAANGQPASFDAYYPEPLNAWYEIRVWPSAEGLSVFFLDITARRTAEQQAQRSTTRLLAISEVTSALASAETITDLVTVMAERGLAALGADGGSVAVPDPDDPTHLLSYITANFGEGTRADFGRLPLAAALPVTMAASTGQRVLLADQAACEALSAQVLAANAATGCQAWASMPLRADARVIGVLTAGWEQAQTFEAEQLNLLDTFAAQCAQALQRMAAREAERSAARAARRAAAQQASLVAIAQALGDAGTQDDVLAVVAAQGAQLLDATGSALCLRDPDGTGVRVLGTDAFSTDAFSTDAFSTDAFSTDGPAQAQHLPVDFPLPLVHSAVTATSHFLTDRAQTAASFPEADAIYTALDVQASASVPLRARGQLLGCLSLGFHHARTWAQDERDLVVAFAALTAQALERINARAAEYAAGVEVARFSETLQRSLLTKPAEPDHLQIAVRYTPAAAEAQVGGDWYDSFLTTAGVTSLVIGDVTGHDRHAAAAMGQLRNLLRGIGYALGEPPAKVLTVLDRAAHDLGVEAMATLVVAQVEQTPEQAVRGLRTLRWSNAGHPPPLFIAPDGTTSYLDTVPDLLLGLDPDTTRTDHEALLQPGSSVLLFTDGLIERRDAPLQAGLDWLAATVADLAHLPLGELCDALLTQVGDRVEDDVALLAVRAHPEDGPRPPEAGPGHDPLHAATLTSERPA